MLMTDEALPQPRAPNGLFEVAQQVMPEEQPNIPTEAESLPTSQTNFLDLPNEIIAQILGEVHEDEDLYQIAFLSQRLNHLALSVYLSRRSFGSGSNDRLVLYDYNSSDALRALNAALFKLPLTRLQYPLNCNKPEDELGHELRGLRGLIDDRFSSLRKATIDLKNAATILPEPLLLAQNGFRRTRNPIPSIIPEDLVGDFLSLLDSIIACGCEAFEFSHSGPQTTAKYDINVAIAEQFSGTHVGVPTTFSFSSVFSLLSLSIGRQRPPTTQKQAKNNLKTFYLHSPIVFHPQLGRWVMTALNDSVITVLSISQQRSLHIDSWALILPCISIPSLTSLTLDSCSMRLPDLLKFLMRHRNVQNLNLGSSFSLSDANARHQVVPPPKGPQLSLIRFSASLDLFIKLFDLAPFLFIPSSLHTLSILLNMPHGLCFIPGMLDVPLESYIWFLKPIKEVRLALSFGGVPSSWVAASRRVGDEDYAHTLITHLDVHLKVYNLSFSLVMKLRELLIRFPALVQLTIFTLAGPSFLTAFQKTGFIEMVQESCPKMVSVDFL